MKKDNKELKEKCVENLKKIGCYGPYTKAFRGGKITNYEQCIGFYIDQDSLLMQKIREIEERDNVKVYAVTHDFIEGFEMYTMLIQPDRYDDEDFETVVYEDEYNGIKYYDCQTYVWNVTEPYFSEYGNAGIVPRFGGLMRIF